MEREGPRKKKSETRSFLLTFRSATPNFTAPRGKYQDEAKISDSTAGVVGRFQNVYGNPVLPFHQSRTVYREKLGHRTLVLPSRFLEWTGITLS